MALAPQTREIILGVLLLFSTIVFAFWFSKINKTKQEELDKKAIDPTIDTTDVERLYLAVLLSFVTSLCGLLAFSIYIVYRYGGERFQKSSTVLGTILASGAVSAVSKPSFEEEIEEVPSERTVLIEKRPTIEQRVEAPVPVQKAEVPVQKDESEDMKIPTIPIVPVIPSTKESYSSTAEVPSGTVKSTKYEEKTLTPEQIESIIRVENEKKLRDEQKMQDEKRKEEENMRKLKEALERAEREKEEKKRLNEETKRMEAEAEARRLRDAIERAELDGKRKELERVEKQRKQEEEGRKLREALERLEQEKAKSREEARRLEERRSQEETEKLRKALEAQGVKIAGEKGKLTKAYNDMSNREIAQAIIDRKITKDSLVNKDFEAKYNATVGSKALSPGQKDLIINYMNGSKITISNYLYEALERAFGLDFIGDMRKRFEGYVERVMKDARKSGSDMETKILGNMSMISDAELDSIYEFIKKSYMSTNDMRTGFIYVCAVFATGPIEGMSTLDNIKALIQRATKASSSSDYDEYDRYERQRRMFATNIASTEPQQKSDKLGPQLAIVKELKEAIAANKDAKDTIRSDIPVEASKAVVTGKKGEVKIDDAKDDKIKQALIQQLKKESEEKEKEKEKEAEEDVYEKSLIGKGINTIRLSNKNFEKVDAVIKQLKTLKDNQKDKDVSTSINKLYSSYTPSKKEISFIAIINLYIAVQKYVINSKMPSDVKGKIVMFIQGLKKKLANERFSGDDLESILNILTNKYDASIVEGIDEYPYIPDDYRIMDKCKKDFIECIKEDVIDVLRNMDIKNKENTAISNLEKQDIITLSEFEALVTKLKEHQKEFKKEEEVRKTNLEYQIDMVINMIGPTNKTTLMTSKNPAKDLIDMVKKDNVRFNDNLKRISSKFMNDKSLQSYNAKIDELTASDWDTSIDTLIKLQETRNAVLETLLESIKREANEFAQRLEYIKNAGQLSEQDTSFVYNYDGITSSIQELKTALGSMDISEIPFVNKIEYIKACKDTIDAITDKSTGLYFPDISTLVNRYGDLGVTSSKSIRYELRLVKTFSSNLKSYINSNISGTDPSAEAKNKLFSMLSSYIDYFNNQLPINTVIDTKLQDEYLAILNSLSVLVFQITQTLDIPTIAVMVSNVEKNNKFVAFVKEGIEVVKQAEKLAISADISKICLTLEKYIQIASSTIKDTVYSQYKNYIDNTDEYEQLGSEYSIKKVIQAYNECIREIEANKKIHNSICVGLKDKAVVTPEMKTSVTNAMASFVSLNEKISRLAGVFDAHIKAITPKKPIDDSIDKNDRDILEAIMKLDTIIGAYVVDMYNTDTPIPDDILSSIRKANITIAGNVGDLARNKEARKQYEANQKVIETNKKVKDLLDEAEKTSSIYDGLDQERRDLINKCIVKHIRDKAMIENPKDVKCSQPLDDIEMKVLMSLITYINDKAVPPQYGGSDPSYANLTANAITIQKLRATRKKEKEEADALTALQADIRNTLNGITDQTNPADIIETLSAYKTQCADRCGDIITEVNTAIDIATSKIETYIASLVDSIDDTTDEAVMEAKLSECNTRVKKQCTSLEAKIDKIKTRRAEENRKKAEEAETQRQEAEKRKKAEEERQRQEEENLKKAEEERQRREEENRKKAIEEEQRRKEAEALNKLRSIIREIDSLANPKTDNELAQAIKYIEKYNDKCDSFKNLDVCSDENRKNINDKADKAREYLEKLKSRFEAYSTETKTSLNEDTDVASIRAECFEMYGELCNALITDIETTIEGIIRERKQRQIEEERQRQIEDEQRREEERAIRVANAESVAKAIDEQVHEKSSVYAAKTDPRELELKRKVTRPLRSCLDDYKNNKDPDQLAKCVNDVAKITPRNHPLRSFVESIDKKLNPNSRLTSSRGEFDQVLPSQEEEEPFPIRSAWEEDTSPEQIVLSEGVLSRQEDEESSPVRSAWEETSPDQIVLSEGVLSRQEEEKPKEQWAEVKPQVGIIPRSGEDEDEIQVTPFDDFEFRKRRKPSKRYTPKRSSPKRLPKRSKKSPSHSKKKPTRKASKRKSLRRTSPILRSVSDLITSRSKRRPSKRRS